MIWISEYSTITLLLLLPIAAHQPDPYSLPARNHNRFFVYGGLSRDINRDEEQGMGEESYVGGGERVREEERWGIRDEGWERWGKGRRVRDEGGEMWREGERWGRSTERWGKVRDEEGEVREQCWKMREDGWGITEEISGMKEEGWGRWSERWGMMDEGG